MTRQLYYEDSHIAEFTARVMSCKTYKDGYAVVLDRTAFFPEGGGQPGDTGRLNESEVLDTRMVNGEIGHILKEPLADGTEVSGRIDWLRRFRLMQNHSGEHVLSGLTHSRFGYENVGFHMAEGIVTLDFDGELTREQLAELEWDANLAIYENHRINTFFPSSEELAGFQYRSKLDLTENVRLVEVEGIDLCACCAPHVSQTGEIGVLRILSAMRHRGGMRLTMACGLNALEEANKTEKNVLSISAALSAPKHETAAAVEKLKNELAETKALCSALRKQLLSLRIKDMPENEGNVLLFEEGLDANSLRELVNAGLEKCGDILAAFSGDDAGGYTYVIGSRTTNLREYAKQLNEAVEGRGGGKPNMLQGTCTANRITIKKEIDRLFGLTQNLREEEK